MEAPEIDKTYSDTPAERDPGSNKAMHAGTSISAGLKGTSKAMAAMNKLMKPTKQKKVMRKFQKQSAQLDMTMTSDAIDETLDKDEAEEKKEELRNQLMAPLMTVLQNPVEFYHQLLLILASVTSVILQAVFQSEGIVGFKSTLLTGLADFSVVLFVMGLGLLVLVYTRYKYAGHHASVWTVSVVLEDYALLCMINKRYIEIFVIPVTILLFIGALAKKVREHGEKDATLNNAAESAKELMKMALVPYLLQLSFVVWTQYMGRLSDGIFIFPNFLLFFSSALCAVTVMIASPPIGESPGAGQVLPVMQKTCIIVFLMTAYSMAAEGLGEDIVFVCIPGLTAVLAWFTICFHHPGHEMTINSATSWSSGSIILSLVVAILACLAPFHAQDGIILASWFIKVFCISISSSALSYFHVWLLRQWPGSTPDCNGLVKLLKFSSLISCIISASILLLTVISVDGQILHEATSSLQYNSIAAAAVVFMLMLSAAWLMLYFSRGAFPEVGDNDPEFTRTRPRSLRRQSTHIEIHRNESMRLLPLWNMANELNRKLDILSQSPQRLHMVRMDLSSFRTLVNHMTRNSNCEPAVLKLAWDLSDLLDYMTQLQPFEYYDDFLEYSDHPYADDEIDVGQRDFTDKLAELKLGIAAVTEDSPRTKAPKVNPNLSGHYGVSMYAHAEQAKYMQEMLTHAGSERPEVVCIFQTGGGSRKMDLIVRVYQQIQDAQMFQTNVSVKADLNPDMAKLIKNMVTQADAEYCIDKTPDQWNTDTLSQVLQKKRYLIVVDDLRSKEDWSTIKEWFPENKERSRIIISTTCEDVAKTCDQFYWLPVPVEMEVETLFSKKICGSLSGIFASKPHAEDAFSGSGLQWKELEQMKELIRVRYNKLLPNLRICLLYLSIFQENHEIDIERLVRLWIANDFIYDLQGESEQDRQSMEQRARSYITELIAGKFIIPSQWNLDDTVRSCRVHQLVYEFIVYQAIEEKLILHRKEENIVSSNHTVRRWHNITKPDKAASGHQGPSLSHVVSVTVFGQAHGIPPLTKRRLLRVLDFEDCEGPVCLDGLCELLLLRYLSLKGTDVSDLRSAQIGELKYLQTLDVRSTKVEKLPSSIVSLQNLMHLLAGNAELPSCIGQMKGLLTLSCAIGGMSSVNIIEELSTIPNLEQLELEDQAVEDQKQITFLSNGFSRLKKVRIKCSFSSVIFDIDALPMVEVLELKVEKENPEKSARVSGIEHLVSLTHVIVESSQPGEGSRPTLAAVTKAAGRIHKNHPKVIFPGF